MAGSLRNIRNRSFTSLRTSFAQSTYVFHSSILHLSSTTCVLFVKKMKKELEGERVPRGDFSNLRCQGFPIGIQEAFWTDFGSEPHINWEAKGLKGIYCWHSLEDADYPKEALILRWSKNNIDTEDAQICSFNINLPFQWFSSVLRLILCFSAVALTLGTSWLSRSVITPRIRCVLAILFEFEV